MLTKSKIIYQTMTMDVDSPDTYQLKIEANFRLKKLTNDEADRLDKLEADLENLIFKLRRRRKKK